MILYTEGYIFSIYNSFDIIKGIIVGRGKVRKMQVVVFNLNNENCGAEVSQVQEIVKFSECG